MLGGLLTATGLRSNQESVQLLCCLLRDAVVHVLVQIGRQLIGTVPENIRNGAKRNPACGE